MAKTALLSCGHSVAWGEDDARSGCPYCRIADLEAEYRISDEAWVEREAALVARIAELEAELENQLWVCTETITALDAQWERACNRVLPHPSEYLPDIKRRVKEERDE